jgi:hypothetical protein
MPTPSQTSIGAACVLLAPKPGCVVRTADPDAGRPCPFGAAKLTAVLQVTGARRSSRPQGFDSLARAKLQGCIRLASIGVTIIALSYAARADDRGTPEEREACTPDVFRLCSGSIPDTDQIVSCLHANKRWLSEKCRGVISVRNSKMPDRSTK